MTHEDLELLGGFEMVSAASAVLYYCIQSHHPGEVSWNEERLHEHADRLEASAERRVEEIAWAVKAEEPNAQPFQRLQSLIHCVLYECFHVLKTGKLGEGLPDDPVRTWLETTFRDAVLEDERVMKSAAMLKVGLDRGDPGVEVCRRFLADFVKTLVEEG